MKKILRFLGIIALVAIIGLSMIGCDEIIQFIPVTLITGVPATATVGEQLTLTGTVSPSSATNTAILWSVENPGTTGATITEGNKLNTTGPGVAVIMATILNGTAEGVNFTQSFNITVAGETFVAVTGIENGPATAIIGTPLTLTGTVVPSNATDQIITWFVADTGTTGATISENTFIATTEGTAVVRATIDNGTAIGIGYTQDFQISVITTLAPVTDITLTSSEASAGTAFALAGTVQPQNATYRNIEWSVTDAGTTGAVISGNTLTATGPGTVSVKATIVDGAAIGTNYTKDFTITVIMPVSEIILENDTAVVGQNLILSGTVLPSNASKSAIVWSIINTNGTAATITGGNIFNAPQTGWGAIVEARIADGLGTGIDYTQEFSINVLPTLAGSVTINGVPRVGSTLTANTAALGGGGEISYQWAVGTTANGTFTNIEGATASTYVPAIANLGGFIRVTVTRAGFAGSVVSVPVGPVAQAPAETGTVTGTVTVTDGVQTSTVEIENAGSLNLPSSGSLTVTVSGAYQSYQWYVNGTLVIGANGPSLTLQGSNYSAGDHRIVVVATRNGVPNSKVLLFTVN